ncbi:CAP domain-containing protein [Salinimicrobium sp. CDJ15-81-2]|nr:CAP domain-containing protein [Salinimicrobium nanhaiense]
MNAEVGKYCISGLSILLTLLFLLMSCSGEGGDDEVLDPPFSAYSSLELEVLNLVNDHRNSLGLVELQRLEEISFQAKLHSNHMAGANEVCHHDFGSRLKILKEQVGARSMGENVGYGYRTSEAILKAWLNSPNHRNIIESENTHFGVSATSAEGKMYVTLIFIRK